jgi:hypothetical protein
MGVSGVDDCGGLMIRDHSGSLLKLETGYFGRWPAEDMVGWVTMKIWRDFIRSALDRKTDLCGPEH